MSQRLEREESSDGNAQMSKRAGLTKTANKQKLHQQSSDQTMSTPAAHAKNQGHKNDPFYIAKRGLIRKAESLNKKFETDVFIVIHQKQSDKIYAFTSDKNYSLERISDLILRDVRAGAFLKKNRIFEDTDFQQVKQNVQDMQRACPGFPGGEVFGQTNPLSNENESS